MAVRKRIIKTKDGETTRWEAGVLVGQKRLRRLFITKKDADAWIVETRHALRGGQFRIDASKFTVADLMARWSQNLEDRRKRGEITRGYITGVLGHIRNYILADRSTFQSPHRYATPFQGGLGHVKLSELTKGQVVAFKDRLRDAGVTVPQTRAIVTSLVTGLEYGIDTDLLAGNPARGITVKGARNEGSQKVVSPPPEAVATLLELAPPDFAVQIFFAAAVGARAGEQRALRWRHFDFEKKVVHIQTRVDAWGNEDGQGTKSAAGTRTVPISDQLIGRLRSWRGRSKFNKDDDLVFPNSKGGYGSHGSMLKLRWYPLFARWRELHAAGTVKVKPPIDHYRWHSLRHFAISSWIDAHYPAKVVQTWAGHSAMAITLDRYGHMFESESDAVGISEIADRLARKTARDQD